MTIKEKLDSKSYYAKNEVPRFSRMTATWNRIKYLQQADFVKDYWFEKGKLMTGFKTLVTLQACALHIGLVLLDCPNPGFLFLYISDGKFLQAGERERQRYIKCP